MNLFASCAGYICDISSETNRTFRLTFLYSCFRIGYLFANLLGGIISNALDYGYMFIIWEIVMVVTLVYGIFFVENVIPEQSKEQKLKDENPSLIVRVMKLLNFDKFITSFKVTMKKREGYTRGKILALVIGMCAPIVAWNGK